MRHYQLVAMKHPAQTERRFHNVWKSQRKLGGHRLAENCSVKQKKNKKPL